MPILQITRRRVEDWRTAALTGLAVGIMAILPLMLINWLVADRSFFEPLMMVAAMVVGPHVIDQTSPGLVLTGAVLHLSLSVLYTLMGAMLFHRLPLAASVLLGALMGLLLYLVNFYIFTAVFPWFAAARHPITLLAHMLFGLLVGWSYKGAERPEVEVHEVAG